LDAPPPPELPVLPAVRGPIVDTAIAALVAGFEQCTLPKEQFTHEAHLTTAMWYLRHYPQAEATNRMRRGIQRYNASVGGSPTAYHETITLAWIAVIRVNLQSALARGELGYTLPSARLHIHLPTL
jgi:hypothetical protein